MDFWSVIIIVVMAIIALIVFYIIGIYNKLVSSCNKVNDKWQEIDKLLNEKIAIVFKLIEVIRSYTDSEEVLLNDVLTSRNRLSNAIGISDKISANETLNKKLSNLINLDKNYESLASDKKFNSLVSKISEIDNSIVYSKEFYNEFVYKHNSFLDKFLVSLIARVFKFDKYVLFKQGYYEQSQRYY